MNGDGTLRPDELKRLLFILDQARLEHLIVDVTFTYEHITGMTPATARVGIMAATDALRSYDNLLFDIQNERNVPDRRFMSEEDVASIFAGIKAVDPARIGFADNAPVDDDPDTPRSFAAKVGLDVVAYHDPRSPRWYQFPTMDAMLRKLKTAGRPVYLQEPNATRDPLFPYPANDRAEYFLQALANAKLAGAAAWCFHTEVGVDFRNGPRLLEDRLRAHHEPEWVFVNSLIPRVIFQANNGVNYLVAEGGGGGGVRADRTAAGPGAWELLGVVSLTGGPLISGDRVSLNTSDGTHYLQAVNGGGGSSLRAASVSVGPRKPFTIERLANGVVLHGDAIALRANDTPWYVVAEAGGGGNVFVNTTSRGVRETFTIFFISPHISDLAALRGKTKIRDGR